MSVTTDTSGQIKILPPKTAEEIVVRERERKARTTLLMAIPEDHLAKFHKMTDAKEMWNAIKSRFGGNDESKKMQKYILKQQFEGFTVSNTDGIHKGYERFQSLLSQLEIHGAGVSTEDANQKFLRSLPSAWLQDLATKKSMKLVKYQSSRILLIMEYLVKISKKARILELKRRNMKIIVLTSYMPYPSRKIQRICAFTSPKTTREQGSIRRI
ncbi:hypothetical protein Tco_0163772 [Tanacetum coccineum]